MIKKILVPQDGSEHSSAALSYGIYIARKFGAAIKGIYVVDVVALEGPFLHDVSGSLGFEPYLNFSTKMREVLEGRGKAVMERFEEVCKNEGVVCETLTTSGIVGSEICEAAKISDLIVMGSRGVNVKFEYGLLGSTTETVVRRSSVPVLVTPKTFSQPQKPLLAYDGSPNASRAMHSAAEWSKALGLPLTVLTVGEEETKARLLKNAQGYLLPYDVKASFTGITGDPADAIVKYYRENAFDLLFMGATHHSKIVEMVLGSTTEHVMRMVSGPFFLQR